MISKNYIKCILYIILSEIYKYPPVNTFYSRFLSQLFTLLQYILLLYLYHTHIPHYGVI